eukprot:52912-Chlamydomonas_euryale.AAC.5
MLTAGGRAHADGWRAGACGRLEGGRMRKAAVQTGQSHTAPRLPCSSWAHMQHGAALACLTPAPSRLWQPLAAPACARLPPLCHHLSKAVVEAKHYSGHRIKASTVVLEP